MKICASNVFCLHHVVTHYLLISHPGLKSCSQAQCRDSKPCATRDYAHELCIQTCHTVLTSMKSHSFIVASAAPWYNLNLWLSHLSGDDRSRIMRVCEGACAHMPLATWYQWAGSGVGVKGDQCYSEKKLLVIAGIDWPRTIYWGRGRGRDSRRVAINIFNVPLPRDIEESFHIEKVCIPFQFALSLEWS